MGDPRPPKHRVFNDDEKWLEQFLVKLNRKPAKCCAGCRRGTATHPGPCSDVECQCHVNPPRACRACGRTYSAPDMEFHVQQVHGGQEGSHYE